LWQKRVSIISTFYFLRDGDISDTLHLSEILVNEQHDLLQKAVGWALREMGKVDDTVLYAFLDNHAATMPRTMLRYSIEKLPQNKRNFYMSLKLKLT
jgi:3-methyladenine DNA glycosylase AlkD